jgi:SAM-dependent methyltransferase
MASGVLDKLHGGYIHPRRARVLRDHLAALIPLRARVLDVGCGDGLIASLILEQRPDLSIKGVDVLVRPNTLLPVDEFDGQTLPYDDQSFDVILFVDVLHHSHEPLRLLREAARVASQSIIIKDHLRDGFLAGPTLRFMDFVGNARHSVALPYNYLARSQWSRAFSDLGLTTSSWQTNLGLYAKPFSWFFERELHFIAQINVTNNSRLNATVSD